MKKRVFMIIAAVCVFAILAMTSCGKSEFGMKENTEKHMVISAENATVDSMFEVGTLEVEEGESITITSNLEKGSVRVEILGQPEQTIDEVPEMLGESIMKADLSPGDSQSGTVDAGSYLIKATVLEKATGTVDIDAAGK